MPHRSTLTLFRVVSTQNRHDNVGTLMTENPYSTPHHSGDSIVSSNDVLQDLPLSKLAPRVFLKWEILRIPYIGILGLFTFLLVGVSGFASPKLIVMVFEGAIVANIAYFAGPLLETYVRWLGFHAVWLRWTLFIVGTMFAMFLTVASLSVILLLPQPASRSQTASGT